MRCVNCFVSKSHNRRETETERSAHFNRYVSASVMRHCNGIVVPLQCPICMVMEL